MKAKFSVVFDEGISRSTKERFISFLDKNGILHNDVLSISKAYAGIPDRRILGHLLNTGTIFLTQDKPLHNKALTQGFKSYYVDQDRFVGEKLKGIRPKKNPPLPTGNESELKDNYYLPHTPIRPYLLPSSARGIKRLRTKRRRIRSYFGEIDKVVKVTATVSFLTNKQHILIGIKTRLYPENGEMKALDATEKYVLEKAAAEESQIVAINHVLIFLIQLMLHPIETNIFYDETGFSYPLPSIPLREEDRHAKIYSEMSGVFPELTFTPLSKGFFIERLRSKLRDLSRKKTNEIVAGNISDIMERVFKEYRFKNQEMQRQDTLHKLSI